MKPISLLAIAFLAYSLFLFATCCYFVAVGLRNKGKNDNIDG